MYQAEAPEPKGQAEKLVDRIEVGELSAFNTEFANIPDAEKLKIAIQMTMVNGEHRQQNPELPIIITNIAGDMRVEDGKFKSTNKLESISVRTARSICNPARWFGDTHGPQQYLYRPKK